MKSASPQHNSHDVQRPRKRSAARIAQEMRAALTQIDSQLAELQREAAKAMRTTRGDYLTRQLERTELESLTPPLPRRALNALRAGGITTVADARWLSRERLDAIPGVGAKAIDALAAATVDFENERREEAIRLGEEAGKPILARLEALRSSLPDRETVLCFITTVDRAQRIRAAEGRVYRRRSLSDDQTTLVQWLNESVEPAWKRANEVPKGQRAVDGDSAQLAAWTSTIGFLSETTPAGARAVSPVQAAWESEKGKRWIIAGAVGVLGLIGLGLNALAENGDGKPAAHIELAEATTTSSELTSDSLESTLNDELGGDGADSEMRSIDEVAAAAAADLDNGGDGSLDNSTTAMPTTMPPTTPPPPTRPPTTLPRPTLPPTTFPTTVAALAEGADEADTAEGCNTNYSGCVPIASDVDCAGGSGNGPAYVSGPIRIIGSDPYGLDHDSDGIGCEDG